MATPKADYTFYSDVYGGVAIEESEWKRYAAQAVAYLEKLNAMSVVTPYGDDEERAWSMAACAVAEAYHNLDVAANGGADASGASVSSASVGSVSVSYDPTFGGAVDLTAAGQAKALHVAASQYLHIYLGRG